MELLAPAGNKQKMEIAFHYGADAVYVGGQAFNLRKKSDNFSIEEFESGLALAKELDKKVYLTLNSYLHQSDVAKLKDYLREISHLPFDGYIVSDLGVLSLLKNIIPNAEAHISTQANILNSESVKMYESLGASRVILGRECNLDEIKSIRESTMLEIEVFVHGAVCMSYSGRCLLSNYMSSRDANGGDCVQVCRWNFKGYSNKPNPHVHDGGNDSSCCGGSSSGCGCDNHSERSSELADMNDDSEGTKFYLEEKSRKGQFFPIEEGDEYTTIMSAKDLRMAEHLHELQAAGVDSLKIEGRMKSIYYVANTIRVYRTLINTLYRLGSGQEYVEALSKEPIKSYLAELDTISRRESDTGFFFYGREPIDSGDIEALKTSEQSTKAIINEDTENRKGVEPTLKSYLAGRRLMAMVVESEGKYSKIVVYNTIKTNTDLVYIGRSFINQNDNMYKLYVKDGLGKFVEVESVRNIDDAYILPASDIMLTKYDIITCS